MPLKGVKYRVTTEGGKKVRLAFNKKGVVLEAKSLDSGAVHTPAEFAADRKKAAARKRRS